MYPSHLRACYWYILSVRKYELQRTKATEKTSSTVERRGRFSSKPHDALHQESINIIYKPFTHRRGRINRRKILCQQKKATAFATFPANPSASPTKKTRHCYEHFHKKIRLPNRHELAYPAISTALSPIRYISRAMPVHATGRPGVLLMLLMFRIPRMHIQGVILSVH